MTPGNPNQDLVLGIDGGGSKTTALLADFNGKILGQGRAGASNMQALGEETARRTLITAVEAAFANAYLPRRTAAIAGLGLSGVDRPEEHARVQQWMREDRLAHRTVLGNDSSLLLWSGALEGWGLAVISGTGSIVYGRTADRQTARAGGWGYRLGDEGSGYAIGTSALRAVTRAADGRGPGTVLTASILQHWKLAQPEDLIPHVYSNLPYPQIASLAKLVNQAAEENDAVACAILLEAAGELAEAAHAVCRKLGFQGEVPAALGGGVLVNSAQLRDELLRLAAGQGMALQPVEIVRQPALGAVRMAIAALQNQP